MQSTKNVETTLLLLCTCINELLFNNKALMYVLFRNTFNSKMQVRPKNVILAEVKAEVHVFYHILCLHLG